jgi:hypothetical protein
MPAALIPLARTPSFVHCGNSRLRRCVDLTRIFRTCFCARMDQVQVRLDHAQNGLSSDVAMTPICRIQKRFEHESPVGLSVWGQIIPKALVTIHVTLSITLKTCSNMRDVRAEVRANPLIFLYNRSLAARQRVNVPQSFYRTVPHRFH